MNLFDEIKPEIQQLIDDNTDILNECLPKWIQAEKAARSGSLAVKVIDYLTIAKRRKSTHQKRLRTDIPKRLTMINKLVRKGYKFEDFKAVIDHKIQQWWGTDFHDNITPETLFAMDNFPKYHEAALSVAVKMVSSPENMVGTIRAMEDE